MQTIEQALEKLSRSKFRSSFHLNAEDKDYIDRKGMDIIASHAADFIAKNYLRPTLPTTADRPHGADILYLKPSTHVHAAAEDVWKSGIMYQRE